jgi:predicted ATPase/DNA-binding CsgD family transcriptional regulator
MTATVRGRAGNLPLEMSSFVGRRREVAEARRLLTAFRLVTLAGVGGVGKTRLALRVAAEARRTFDDGVWFVELGNLHDSALLAHTVLDSLGLREQPGRPPLALLTEYLASRQILVVLDNCEHLVAECAELVQTMLAAGPEVRVLATSREPLNVRGEASLAVPVLSVPGERQARSPSELYGFEAVALFAERAGTAVPGFSITTENDVAVAEICRRLDGLPLAIELAAVRLRALSAQQIERRLSDRYRLLTAGPRDRPARQQTLRACIQWSFDLCTPLEQLLWARLAVFAGGFDLDAAEGICAGDGLAPEDMLDLVTSLVDKSILNRDENGDVVRYRLLDSLREFGTERLRHSGEYGAVRRRHRDWYAELAGRSDADWIGPRQAEWQTRLSLEHADIRAALDFSLAEPGEAQVALRTALALHWYWFTRGGFSEGRHWLDQALARDPVLSEIRSRALYTDSMLAELQGDFAAAAILVERGDDLAARLGSAYPRIHAALAGGFFGCLGGDPADAVTHFERALEILGTNGDTRCEVEAWLGLALASSLLGDAPRASACHERTLALLEPRGEVWYRSYSLWNLGFAAWLHGDQQRAANLFQKSLELKRMVDDPSGTGWSIEGMAWVAASEHDARRAATLLGAAASISEAMGTLAVPNPGLVDAHQHCEQQARQELSEGEYQAAYEHGMKLSLSDAIAYALREKAKVAPPADGPDKTMLTRREWEVADLIAEGLTNKEIAARLVISQRTAEGHVERILVKLGVTSRARVAAWITARAKQDGGAGSP